ncbi:MAG: hypothetical protein QME05_01485 [Candidatus Margulisbacteria bacterium]|nr:hypothetical protein [Candidatus Margulisiibacteriota bacterium]
MDIKVVNAFLAEYIRPEAPSRFTIVGMPLNIALKDPEKPCYPLLSFVHMQAESAGKAELALRIVDTKAKKDVAAYKVNLEIKAEDPNLKRDGFVNMAILRPVGKITFDRAGEFTVAIAIDKIVKKSFKLSVIKV